MAEGEQDDSIWMEEDDYCQREVLPLSSISWCQAEIGRIKDLAAKHRIEVEQPRVTVYSRMYERESPPALLSSLGIRRVEVDDLMHAFGFQRPRVVGADVPNNVAAYRGDTGNKDLRSAMFIDWDESDVVESIWLPGPLGPEEEDLMSALQQLGSRYPLLYVDWPWGLVGAIDGSPSLKEIAARLEEVRRRNRSEGLP